METILRLADGLDRIPRTAGRWGARLMLPLIAIIMYDVVTRKIQVIQQLVLNSPLYDYISPTKLQEMEWHLHAVVFLLAYGAAYLANTHVRVDVWRESQPTRRRAWAELLGLAILAIPYFLLLLYFGWDFVLKSYFQNEASTAMTGLSHRWIIKAFLLTGVALMLAAFAATLLRLIVYLFGDPPQARAAHRRLAMLQGDPKPEAAAR